MDPAVLIGTAPAMRQLRATILSAARSDLSVLIMGERGTGKEVVARCIHAASRRRLCAFAAVNGGDIPDSRLESELFGEMRNGFTDLIHHSGGFIPQAAGGTVFFAELCEMSMRMQEVLLRFTDRREFHPVGDDELPRHADVRLMTASSRSPAARIAAGMLREDLFYRMNSIRVDVPSLRERRSDIPVLVQHFLEKAARLRGLTPPTLTPDETRSLVAYQWPGNLPELRNVAERLLMQRHFGPLTAHDLPSEVRDPKDSIARVRRAPLHNDGTQD